MVRSKSLVQGDEAERGGERERETDQQRRECQTQTILYTG